jgi:myo-inositol-1(or 4)-monophosphatase
MMLERELEIATRLAFRAGASLRRYQAGPMDVRYKANGEPVTAGDLDADAIIRAGLEAEFPADVVFSEETPDSPRRLSATRVWIVDPLDGTSNFVAGGDEYSVSIGLAVAGLPALGVVYAPAREQMFTGYPPVGVTLNGAPVKASDTADLDRARVSVSRKEWRRGLDNLAGKLPMIPMASMAHKLARVAAGLDDAVFSAAGRKEWGTCAGVALVRAAGGQATLLDGGDIAFNRAERRQPLGMVAAGPRLHPLLLERLRDLLFGRVGSRP